MKLIITTPERLTTINNVNKVTIPGSEGSFTILDRHAPLITTMKAGKVRYETKGEWTKIQVNSGAVKVLNDVVEIIHE